jgi:tRNA(Ile)-lysidine synthase
MIRFKKVFSKSNTKLVCFSGGVDSLACLDFLKRGGWSVTAFHFNHKLRPENDLMEDSVRKFCKESNTDLIVKNGLEYNIGDGSEKDCREARYKSIGDVWEGDVVVCHHLGDCVESYLMGCLDGDSKRIPVCTDWGKFKVWRPFLLNKKVEFINWVVKRGLEKWIVEDSTNRDNSYRRNWIRNELIPKIEEKYRGLDKVVLKKIEEEYSKYL